MLASTLKEIYERKLFPFAGKAQDAVVPNFIRNAAKRLLEIKNL